ncbi:hypothetical protein [Lactobacillus amylolyticus]|uniref:hypothetical protein n=1 Tax=Lactobacillus amylolyticus TaxID=83683 RepID=UPI00249329D0|nr:hypothetical protein [Lactobacillus amylolyticus]
MTPNEFYQLRRKHELTKRAKKLVKECGNNTQDMIKKIAFKQEAGMFPKDYIERYDHTWKD